jgi:hypothetical protein
MPSSDVNKLVQGRYVIRLAPWTVIYVDTSMFGQFPADSVESRYASSKRYAGNYDGVQHALQGKCKSDNEHITHIHIPT